MTPKRYFADRDGDMFEDESGDYVHIDDYNLLASRYAELLESISVSKVIRDKELSDNIKNMKLVRISHKDKSDQSGTEDERELFTEDDVKEAFFGEDQPENTQNLTFPYWD